MIKRLKSSYLLHQFKDTSSWGGLNPWSLTSSVQQVVVYIRSRDISSVVRRCHQQAPRPNKRIKHSLSRLAQCQVRHDQGQGGIHAGISWTKRKGNYNHQAYFVLFQKVKELHCQTIKFKNSKVETYFQSK